MVEALDRAWDRHIKQEERIEKQQSYGDTRVALEFAKRQLHVVAGAVQRRLETPSRTEQPLAMILRSLEPEVIALCILQSAIHCVVKDSGFTSDCVYIGKALRDECWGAGLIKDAPKLANWAIEEATRKHGDLERRKAFVRAAVSRKGYRAKEWSSKLCLFAGAWALDLLVNNSEVFSFEETRDPKYGKLERRLRVAPGSTDEAFTLVEEMVRRSPVYAPQLKPPDPWTDVNQGGPTDARLLRSPLIRNVSHKDIHAAAREAIKDGSMQPTLSALNTLQSVGFRINQPVLKVMLECMDRGIEVSGLPQQKDLKDLGPAPTEDLEALRVWKIRARDRHSYNDTQRNDHIGYSHDIGLLREIGDHTFYVPLNLDWRGRVNAMCSPNFQGSDRVRGLFLFADGLPITDEGLYWLKVHVANSGEFAGVDKKPFTQRIAWVDQNLERILSVSKDPMEDLWWTKASNPFAFLAACMELAAALQTPWGTFITHLPVSFDGSCSGLQHLTAMTRSPEAALVNLTPNDHPQDVYQTVADAVIGELKVSEDPRAKVWLDYLADNSARKVFKRNVMTYFYGSKPYGLATQQQTDLMGELKNQVSKGERDVHPFGDQQQQLDAAKFIGPLVYRTIGKVVRLPAEAMTMLQKIARALAHEQKAARWVTPAGMPVINRYHEEIGKRIRLWMHDRGVVYRPVIYTPTNKIHKRDAANGIAPNFVHSMDAAHLFRTVNAAYREGIRAMATVHDSFGCLAPQAGRFREIIREEFVRMYQEHDVLAQVHEQSSYDLSVHGQQRLPELPNYGSLNIQEVLNAEYAFA